MYKLWAGQDEDFGLEQITSNSQDRYKFRTSPLRNVALQPAFFHDGSFTRLEGAVRHHLDVFASARNYDPVRAGVADDLSLLRGPIEPILARVDPLMVTPNSLNVSGGRNVMQNRRFSFFELFTGSSLEDFLAFDAKRSPRRARLRLYGLDKTT